MVEAIAAAPEKSLPEIARDDAELEGIYRFLNNDGIDPVEMLVPHFEATAERSAGLKSVLVIHDATKMLYPLEDDLRDGLGRHGNKQGFIALPALVLSGDGKNKPLGLAALDAWTEDSEPVKPGSKGAKARQSWGRIEGDRWLGSIYEAVAWRVLLLRQENRVNPDAPAETVLSPLMIFVLRATGRRPLSAKPTVGEAVLAVAGLGGHIKNNGPPGCIVLRRGMERLLERTNALVAMVELLGAARKK